MDRNGESGRGVAFANTVVWGAITLMMTGASALSAYASFNSAAHGEIAPAVMAAGMTVAAAAIGTAAGYVAKHAARDAFSTAAQAEKKELPSFFTGLFKANEDREDGIQPPPPK